MLSLWCLPLGSVFPSPLNSLWPHAGTVWCFVFRCKGILWCSFPEDQELVWHCSCRDWAGVSKCAGLALLFVDRVMTGVAPMPQDADCARLLRGYCLNTLHFHFLCKRWSRWTGTFSPMHCNLSAWKGCLNSESNAHRVVFPRSWFVFWCWTEYVNVSGKTWIPGSVRVSNCVCIHAVSITAFCRLRLYRAWAEGF